MNMFVGKKKKRTETNAPSPMDKTMRHLGVHMRNENENLHNRKTIRTIEIIRSFYQRNGKLRGRSAPSLTNGL